MKTIFGCFKKWRERKEYRPYEDDICFNKWREMQHGRLPDDGNVHVDDLELVGPGYLQRWLQYIQELAQVLVVNVLGA